jgi:hypothetical protein
MNPRKVRDSHVKNRMKDDRLMDHLALPVTRQGGGRRTRGEEWNREVRTDLD